MYKYIARRYPPPWFCGLVAETLIYLSPTFVSREYYTVAPTVGLLPSDGPGHSLRITQASSAKHGNQTDTSTRLDVPRSAAQVEHYVFTFGFSV